MYCEMFRYARFIADDVFPIVTLPQGTMEWLPSQMLNPTDVFHRYDRLKCAHYVANGFTICVICDDGWGNTLWLPFHCFGIIGLGDHEGRPYDFQNGVKMIGHDDVFVQSNIRETFGQFQPFVFHHTTGIIMDHCAMDNITKQTLTMADTNGNEIQTFLRVIISFQTDRSPAMDMWVVSVHRCLLLSLAKLVMLET
jgi:hypothetical protein